MTFQRHILGELTQRGYMMVDARHTLLSQSVCPKPSLLASCQEFHGQKRTPSWKFTWMGRKKDIPVRTKSCLQRDCDLSVDQHTTTLFWLNRYRWAGSESADSQLYVCMTHYSHCQPVWSLGVVRTQCWLCGKGNFLREIQYPRNSPKAQRLMVNKNSVKSLVCLDPWNPNQNI